MADAESGSGSLVLGMDAGTLSGSLSPLQRARPWTCSGGSRGWKCQPVSPHSPCNAALMQELRLKTTTPQHAWEAPYELLKKAGARVPAEALTQLL